MNYRHIYHVGNFADVCKHNILLLLLAYLTRKESGFCYLETHAGSGGYDLTSVETQKSKEYQNGIELLLRASNLPIQIQNYVDLIWSYNQIAQPRILHYYPGSPQLARTFIRKQDKVILMELHSEEANTLKQLWVKDKQVAVHHMDGYQGLKAFLPPTENRGLVFIDPPFEVKTEFAQLVAGVQLIYKRWAHGTVAIWYPIKARRDIDRFHFQLQQLGIKKILVAELCIFPDDVAIRLNGSGMIIINPPWQFEQTVTELLNHLFVLLKPRTEQKPVVKWLVAE